MVDTEENSLEKELLEIMKKAPPRKKHIYENATIDATGGRYFTGSGPKMDLIRKQAWDIERRRNPAAQTALYKS